MIMRTNFYWLAFILAASLFSVTVTATTELEPAVSSHVTAVALPADAQRILPQSVPAEVRQTLQQLLAEGNGKVRQGATEVLVWAGANYKKANAPRIVDRLTETLKVDGWKYEINAQESGLTVFSLLKERGQRRAVIGFYGATDDALVFAWTELLPGANASARPETNESSNIQSAPTGGIPREFIGSWDNGSVSMITRQNAITGATTPGRSSRFEYTFSADGTFGFTGLMQTTNYSCTDTLYNEKAGRVRFSGSTLTLTPTKNFWRRTNSCAASQNSERNYTLTEETYQWRLKTDEYGKRLICLTNDKGESCYRFKDK
jgi:hypothetical protein